MNLKINQCIGYSIVLSVLFLAQCTKSNDDDDEQIILAATALMSSGANTSTFSYRIVDTGQTKCFNSNSGGEAPCNKTGYDADYNGNQPSYSKTADGKIVTDNVTGLMWSQSSDLNGDGNVNYLDKKYPEEAKTYCENLSLGGYEDWRLPDIKTLYSLILFTGKDASTLIACSTEGSSSCNSNSLTLFLDTNYFDKAFGDIQALSRGANANERVIDAQYATTTNYVSKTMEGDTTVFGVNFVDGRIKGYGYYKSNTNSFFKKFYVRCVRGNSNYGVNQFIENSNQTILDAATGLVWQKSDSDSTSFDNAVSVCENATTDNFSDWRLPNAKELHSIVDYTRSPDTSSSAALDSKFTATSITNEDGKTDYAYYWASTTHLDEIGGTITVDNYGQKGTYVAFGRSPGYFNSKYLDVHGAGAQKSNNKQTIPNTHSSINLGNGLFYYHGPQGDVLRVNNKVRCVRNQ